MRVVFVSVQLLGKTLQDRQSVACGSISYSVTGVPVHDLVAQLSFQMVSLQTCSTVYYMHPCDKCCSIIVYERLYGWLK